MDVTALSFSCALRADIFDYSNRTVENIFFYSSPAIISYTR